MTRLEDQLRQETERVDAQIGWAVTDLERQLLDLEERHIEAAALAQRANALLHRAVVSKKAVEEALATLKKQLPPGEVPMSGGQDA